MESAAARSFVESLSAILPAGKVELLHTLGTLGGRRGAAQPYDLRQAHDLPQPHGLPQAHGLPQPQPQADARAWQLAALSGRLCELTSTVRTPLLTFACSLLHQAQQQGQLAAWVAVGDSTFHPPDVAAWGIDLAALPVVRLHTAPDGARAADQLLRSGAFGLVVLDLASLGPQIDLPLAAQTRLAGLVNKHHATLLFLTRRAVSAGRANRTWPAQHGEGRSETHGEGQIDQIEEPGKSGEGRGFSALGSLVSLRAEGDALRAEAGRFSCELLVTKDKRHGPGWKHLEVCRGPEGLI